MSHILSKRYSATQTTGNHGGLQVRVADTNIALPIDHATVEVFGVDKDGKETLVDVLTTDSSGLTQTIQLNAPPIEFSLQPQSEVRPYSTYNVRVSANGFNSVRIEGVEIFDTETALQEIDLVHQVQPAPRSTIIPLPDNNLWVPGEPKIPESEVKPLPEQTGFVVLDLVVIPEFIVVHAGRPDAYATNYWVPFKDYIKNVASSEIYSTWPVETLRANVLAILSFTLNRVFTEWYRGQGKNFTITNSTAFDQAFTYGRTIYTSISNVVDELFTNYITRQGIMQPLFTQYCDGKTVHCPKWLSQWGSAQLGEQGVGYLDILRNYYGDIYIDKAPIVSGVPVSYPGFTLRPGMSGESVRTIQNQLNVISNNYPAIKKLRTDGVYGPLTAESVKTFQQIFNMPQTGVVDMATWYKISHIYVAVSRLATLV